MPALSLDGRWHSRVVKEMMTFRLHWTAQGKEQVTELRAGSAGDARQAFNALRLPGVLLISVEPIDPAAASLPVPSHSPDSPSDPLIARRKMDKDEDAR